MRPYVLAAAGEGNYSCVGVDSGVVDMPKGTQTCRMRFASRVAKGPYDVTVPRVDNTHCDQYMGNWSHNASSRWARTNGWVRTNSWAMGRGVLVDLQLELLVIRLQRTAKIL